MPSEEICDGVDNDYDGEVDEVLVQSCYSGLPGTVGVGTCVAGIQTYSDGEWGSCEGAILPEDEQLYGCDGLDNVCNGVI